MTSVNTRGRAISWKGSLCLQGWDPLDVFVTLIKELRDGFISPAVPMREHTASLYTMLHSQMEREKKLVKYPDVLEFYINEATVRIWFLIIRYYSCVMVEKVFVQRRWECFPNTLLFFLLFYPNLGTSSIKVVLKTTSSYLVPEFGHEALLSRLSHNFKQSSLHPL